jgi:phosphoglycerol transferase MdoB-like AlkP superfamily enzyme
VKNKKKFNKLIILGEFVLPFVLSCVCQRLSIGMGYYFNLNVLFVNYVLWLAIFLFFIGVFKKHYLAINFYIFFFFLFTLLDRYRIKFLKEPLRFDDIKLIGQMRQVIPFVIKYPNLKTELILSIILMIILFFLIKKVVKTETKTLKTRIVCLILSVFILTIPYFNQGFFTKTLGINKIIFNSWYRLENCQNNGMALCFIYDLKFIKTTPPANYSQSTIKNIFSNISSKSEINKTGEQPNVIVIMSESLFDATKLTNLKFNPDPLADFRPDIKGNMISPMFGGGTANVEFEFLTSLSNYLFEDNSYPYTDLIKKNMPSLFTVFKDNGYQTTAIHPYDPQFYNRKNVYNFFGLDKFTNLDQMSNPQFAGPYVSDKYFTDQILKQLDSTDKKQFIFAVSMQNHDLYEANRFKNQQINISGNISKENKDTLQSYIEGVNLTDQSYQFLKDELTKRTNKPTIVIMFGDHLPFLGDNYGTYVQGGLVSSPSETDWTAKNEIDMHSTPLIMWDNYKLDIPKFGNIGTQVISSNLLNLANIEPEYQFKFTEQLKLNTPFLVKKISLNPDQSMFNNYNLIQYDLLFGKQYLKALK